MVLPGTAAGCGRVWSLLLLVMVSRREGVSEPGPVWVRYSPNRAGVRRGVMGASSFLPGVQIFTALERKEEEEEEKMSWKLRP